jgi:integrase
LWENLWVPARQDCGKKEFLVSELTVARVRSLRTPGMYRDQHGLYLHVVAPGQRYWVFRYMRDGRARVMSLGSADLIALSEARRRHTEARGLLASGVDPLDVRHAADSRHTSQPSFAATTEHYIDGHRAGWRGRRTEDAWRASLVQHAYPMLGDLPVDAIAVDHILAVLEPIWSVKPIIAAQIRYRLEAVLDYGAARGWRPDANPAAWGGRLKALLPARSTVHVVQHRAALAWPEAPAFMAKLGALDTTASKCLAFAVYTAARSMEARGAQWQEIDMATATWTIPASRIKTGKPHRVPLTDPAVDILEQLAATRSTEPLVFLSRAPGRPLADTTLAGVLRQLGYDGITVHGFRSSFRDWCAETGKNADAAELALAHTAPSKVVAAYARSDLLDLRRGLMNAWAGFLASGSGIVVPLRRAG